MDLSKVFPMKNGTPAAADGLEAFDRAEAAPDFAPVPDGVYLARVLLGKLTTTKAGAAGYRLRFELLEGEHAGKTLIRTWTFGTDALRYTKRDLTPFGLTTVAALRTPFPAPGREYVVRLVVALQTGNDGVTRNDIKDVALVRVDESPAARFMLPPSPGEGGKQ